MAHEDPSTPILVGGGRFTQRKVAVESALDPIEMMQRAAESAFEDACARAPGTPLQGAAAARPSSLAAALDAVAMVSMQLEMRLRLSGALGSAPLYRNAPRSIAAKLGAARVTAASDNTERCFVSEGDSGHSPQMLVNEMASRIASGTIDSALVVGCEVLATFMRAVREGYTPVGARAATGGAHTSAMRDATGRKVTTTTSGDNGGSGGSSDKMTGGAPRPKFLQWGDAACTGRGNAGGKAGVDSAQAAEPEVVGGVTQGLQPGVPLITSQEARAGLASPPSVYAMFEQAIRHAYFPERDEAQHRAALGSIFAPFAAAAASAPNRDLSWFPTARDAAEIATPSAANRVVTTPYTKYMCAVMDVDQSAAVLMMSVREAQRLGIDRSRWVYLHGCADASEVPLCVSQRRALHRCFAMRDVGRRTAASANVALSACSHFDVYSCFPSAVQVACHEMGIAMPQAVQDKRGITMEQAPVPLGVGAPMANTALRPLTLTGGLPYHGGPGNNYSTHAIVAMLDTLRAPGHRGDFGLVTANGGFMSKASAGIYSTTPYCETHPDAPEWKREDVAQAQAKLAARAEADNRAELVDEPAGAGTLEHIAVEHGRNGPTRAIAIGTMLGAGADAGKRFLATATDKAVLRWALACDRAGEECDVRFDRQKKRAFFAPLASSKL